MSAEIPIPTVGITPYPDESLAGFLFRLTVAQGYLSTNHMLAPTGDVSPTNRPEPALLANYAKLSGCKISELEPLGWGPPHPHRGSFRGRSLPNAMFRGTREYSRARCACPQCLDESDHHRAWWDIVAISACPAHSARLIDACRRCGMSFSWKRGRDLRACKCGADIRNMAADPLPPDVLAGTALVHGLLGDPRYAAEADTFRALPTMSDLSDGETVEFLWRLGLELIGPRPKIFSVQQPNELAADAHMALLAAQKAVETPGGIEDALDMMVARWSAKRAERAFGRWRSGLADRHGLVVAGIFEKALKINAL